MEVQVLAEDDTNAAVSGLAANDYVITTSSKPGDAEDQQLLLAGAGGVRGNLLQGGGDVAAPVVVGHVGGVAHLDLLGLLAGDGDLDGGVAANDYVITTSSKPLDAGTQVRMVENS